MLASGTQDRGFTLDRSRRIFSGWKNPQHAFLWKGSKIICLMSQLWGMKKNPALFGNYEIAGKIPQFLPSLAERVVCLLVHSASSGEGRSLQGRGYNTLT
jgi:hypothetical protein